MIKFIDFLCRLAGIPEYSLLSKYAPIEYIHRLSDDPTAVYVWQLRRDVDDEKYAERMAKLMQSAGFDPKAVHIYTNDIIGITQLDADTVRVLLEHHYSTDAKAGGR